MPLNSERAELLLSEGEGQISSRNLPSYDLANNRAQSKTGISSIACEEGSLATGGYSGEGGKRPQAEKVHFFKRIIRRQKPTEKPTGLILSQGSDKNPRDTSRHDVDGTTLLVKQKATLFANEDLPAADDETVDNSVQQAFQDANFQRCVSDITMLTQDKYMKREFDVGDPIINQFRQGTKEVQLEENDDEEISVDAKISVASEHTEIIFQPKSPASIHSPPPPPCESSSPAAGFYNRKPIKQYGTATTVDEHASSVHDKLSFATEQEKGRKNRISQLPTIYTSQDSEGPNTAAAMRENWVDPADEVSTLTPTSMIEKHLTPRTTSSGVSNVPKPIPQNSIVEADELILKNISDQDAAFEALSPLSLLNLSQSSCNANSSKNELSSPRATTFNSVPASVEPKNHHKLKLPPPSSENCEGGGMFEKFGNRASQSCVVKDSLKPPALSYSKRSVTFNDVPYDLETITKSSTANLESSQPFGDSIDHDGKIKERVSCIKQTVPNIKSSIIKMDRVTHKIKDATSIQSIGRRVEHDDERQDENSRVNANQDVTNIDEDNSPSPYALYLRAIRPR